MQDLLNENNLNAAAQGIPDVLPVLPVRDVVIFNYMILPLFIGREKSVQAVESALKNGRASAGLRPARGKHRRSRARGPL